MNASTNHKDIKKECNNIEVNISLTVATILQVVDLFVLLILHSTANRKKAMESLIRNKIKNGHFTEEMLSAAFNSHSQVRMKQEVWMTLLFLNVFLNVSFHSYWVLHAIPTVTVSFTRSMLLSEASIPIIRVPNVI